MSDNLIEVPWQELEESTLNNLIEEFVTRDGTDYGELELSMDQKVKQVVAGIKTSAMLLCLMWSLNSATLWILSIGVVTALSPGLPSDRSRVLISCNE